MKIECGDFAYNQFTICEIMVQDYYGGVSVVWWCWSCLRVEGVIRMSDLVLRSGHCNCGHWSLVTLELRRQIMSLVTDVMSNNTLGRMLPAKQ